MTSLPYGWNEAALRDLCLSIEKADPVDLGRKTVQYVDIGSVDGSRHALLDVAEIAAVGAPSRCRQIIHSGDTLFSTVRPYLEKIAYIDDSYDHEFASTGFSVLRPSPRLVPKFLYYFSISSGMLDQVLPYQKGVSYPAVLENEVRATTIPVPPLNEQRRIVDLLEDHLSRLDAADNYLAAAKRRLESLRASTLAEVFSGEPVPLGELAVTSGYGISEKCVVGGPGPAVVRIPNLIDGSVDLADEKRVAKPAADVASSMLQPGDLLIVRTNGSVDLIGRSAVVQPGVDAAFASYLIRYRLDPFRVFPEWVNAMLSAPQSRALLERLAASSAGQHNLSLGKLDGVPIPLPTLEEQGSHLRRLADLGSELSRLTHASQAASRHAADLRSLILAAAFSGQLTGQSSDLERAGEMALG